MSLDEVRCRLIFRPVRDHLLEHFVFKVLPGLANTAHDALVRSSPDRRAVVLYGDCFREYRSAVIGFLRGAPSDEAQSGEYPIGAVTAYCNRFVQEFDTLPHEGYAQFLENRIREDLIKPINYMLKVWLRWVCDGPPNEREFGDILRRDLFPRVRDAWDDPNSPSLNDIPDLCAGWGVPAWLVANPGAEEAQYATRDLTTRLQGEINSGTNAVLEEELKFGNGITALKAHAARESSESFARRTLDDVKTLVAKAHVRPSRTVDGSRSGNRRLDRREQDPDLLLGKWIDEMVAEGKIVTRRLRGGVSAAIVRAEQHKFFEEVVDQLQGPRRKRFYEEAGKLLFTVPMLLEVTGGVKGLAESSAADQRKKFRKVSKRARGSQQPAASKQQSSKLSSKNTPRNTPKNTPK